MSDRSSILATFGLLAAVLIAAPASATGCAGESWIESTLYMGRGPGNDGGVTDVQVQAFVDDTIVPRFPDGFTIMDARGYWRDRKTGRGAGERTLMLVVAHPAGPEADTALRTIADAYIDRFDQQAVLGSSHPVCVTFYERKG